MVVLKFGGTSVASADRMQEVIDILEKNAFPQLVVLSAMSGTTNDLVAIAESLKRSNKSEANERIVQFEDKYIRVLTDLYPDKEIRDHGRRLLQPCFDELQSKLLLSDISPTDEKEILAQGELISSALFALQCEVRGLNTRLIPALQFMRINSDGDPDLDTTSLLIRDLINTIDEETQIIVTQGFICRNPNLEVDNLKRGGSDYTATIIGAILKADEVQIWTDIDGFQNNDPRIVGDTKPVRFLSYREAAELAYFGAKILHPTCVLPVEKGDVPLRLKCTMQPDAPGTLITKASSKYPITAIAAKDGITAIKIYSHRMLQTYGFLTNVFKVFEEHQTAVDMITTSEVSVSLTIDNISNLDEILQDLNQFSEAEAVEEYTIICIVGNALYDESEHINQIFYALREVPIRMVSMGGSRNNISLLVKTKYKVRALQSLNSILNAKEELNLVANTN